MNWRLLAVGTVALLAFSAMGVAAQEPAPSGEPTSPPPAAEPQSPPDDGTAPSPCEGANESCPPPAPSQPSSGPSGDAAAKECMRTATTEQDRRECVQAYCGVHSDQFCARWCQEHPEGANCDNQPPVVKPVQPSPPSDAKPPVDCNDPAKCGDRPDKGGEGDATELRFISFTRDAAERGLRDYTVGDQLVVERLEWVTDGQIQTQRHGSVLEARVGDEKLQLHDEPGGLIAFKGRNSTLVLEFPADASIERLDHAARIRLADGSIALLRYDEAVWSSPRVARLSGFVGLHIPPGLTSAEPLGDDSPRGPVEREARAKFEKAIEDRRLGAQVAVEAGAGDDAEVFSYDDVQVNVSAPRAKATPDDPLEIRVEADLEEGRTVAVDIDPKLLPARNADQVVMRYFDVNDDGSRTEVVLHKASNLADALDPTDDEGQPEYWVVFDAEGAHVLVSVPHWSVHVFTVAAVPVPSVVVGLVVGSAVVVVAAVGLFLRRRD